MSKGSARRPRQVKQETYAANWDAVFGLGRRGQTVEIDSLSEEDQRALLGFTLGDVMRSEREVPPGKNG